MSGSKRLLTKEDVNNIVNLRKNGITVFKLSKWYHCSETTILRALDRTIKTKEFKQEMIPNFLEHCEARWRYVKAAYSGEIDKEMENRIFQWIES